MKLKDIIGSMASKFAALALAFTCAGTAWGAADTSWYDASQTSFTLTTEAQLRGLAELVNGGKNFAGKAITLGADIDLSSADWTPIAPNSDAANRFAGAFDGANHVISNMKVDRSTADPVYEGAGFFGAFAVSGVIRNVIFRNSTVIGTLAHNAKGATANGCAVVVGSLQYGGTIENVTVEDAVVEGNHYVAGIVGYAQSSHGTSTIKNCTVKNLTLVNTPDDYDNNGKYDNGDKTGGIVGYATSGVIIKENTLEGEIDITGYRDIGGIVGAGTGADLDGNAVADDAVVTVTVDQITNAYDPKTPNAGILVGRNLGSGDSATVPANNTTSTSATTNITTAVAVAKIGTTQYGSLAAAARAYESGDTIEIIGDASSMTAPEGWVITAGTPPTLTVDPFTTYTKVAEGFYQNAATYDDSTDFYITSKEGLEYFRDLVNQVGTVADTYVTTYVNASWTAASWYTANIFTGKTVHLMTDVDLGNVEWSPIGQPTNAAGDKRCFYGNFDGEGHKVSNLKATMYTEAIKTWYAGLFGNVAGTQTFSNLTIENVTLVGYDYAGAIIGNAGSNATAFNNCHVTGDIDIKCTMVGAFVGGIVGIGTSAIDDCSVKGNTGSTIEGSTVGGLAGTSTRTAKDNANTVTDSTVTGVTVKSDDNGGQAGGLVGKATNPVTVTGNTVHDVTVTAEQGAADALVGGVGGTVTASSNTTDTNVTVISDPITGSGTAEDPYIIPNLDALKVFRDRVNGGTTYQNKFVKMADNLDIDLASEGSWTPIGNKVNVFKGTFDGNGVIFRNLTINDSALNYAGLFGFMAPGTLKNINIVNVNISANNCIGAIAGGTQGSTYIDNCTVTGTINLSGNHYIGGISGWSYANTTDCLVDGGNAATSFIHGADLTANSGDGDDIGGIIGFAGEAHNKISGCTVKNVTIEGFRQVGGIAGIARVGKTIENCTVENVVVKCIADEYTAENKAAKMAFGGIVGVVDPSTGANDAVTISGCEVSGVSLESTETGKAVARMGYVSGGRYNTAEFTITEDDNVSISNTTVENCTRVEGTLSPVNDPGYIDGPYAARIGNVKYDTLAAALADVTKDAPLTWVSEDAWPVATPVYYNGNFYAVAGTTQNGGGALDHAIAQANTDHASSTDVALIYVRPGYTQTAGNEGAGTFLATYNKHQPFASNIIIYGNNASLGGEAWEPSVTGMTRDMSVAIYNLHDGAGIWGQHNTPYVLTATMENCNNVHEYMVNGSKGSAESIANVTIKNCTFGTRNNVVVASTNPGTVVIDGCTFTENNNNYVVNINNKNGGTTTATISNSTFNGGGTASKGVVRVNGEVEGTTMSGTFENLTFNDTSSAVADIQIGHATEAADNKANVSYTVSGTTGVLKVFETGSTTLKNEGDTAIAAANNYSGDNVALITGSGTQADPYIIANIDALKAFRDRVNAGNTYSGKFIKLTADIDLNNEEWEPIGIYGYRSESNVRSSAVSPNKPFCGTFDGDNHTISNLKMSVTKGGKAYQGAGLFGYTTNTAVIKNLNLHNADVQGRLYVGTIVGYGYTGNMIDNCHVSGVIKVEGSWYLGGLGGSGYMSKITNCSVIGDAGSGSYVRGLGNDTEGIYGDGTSGYIGGIWGFRGEGANVIANCTVKNISVEGQWNGTGGICGIAHYSNIISNCTVEAMTVSASEDDNNCGLIAGSDLSKASEPAKVIDCTVSDGATASAGTGAAQRPVTTQLGAANNNGVLTTPENSALVGSDVVYDESGKITGGTFEKVPDSTLAEGYGPVANAQGLYTVEALPLIATVTAGGTTKNYYDLHKALEAGKADGSVVTLQADVDLAGVAWVPVGTDAEKFCGSIDGNGKVISNLIVNDPLLDYAGLIGYGNGGSTKQTIKDLTISNATITARMYVGVLGGCLYANNSINNVTVKGLIQATGNYKVGGVVGGGYIHAYDSSIVGDEGSFVKGLYLGAKNETVNGSVLPYDCEGDNVGGFIGHMGEGSGIGLYNCSASGLTVMGSRKVGGLVGTLPPENTLENVNAHDITVGTTATAAYADDNKSTMEVGGIVGSYYNNGTGGVISGTVQDITIAELPTGITGSGDGKNISYGLVTGGNRGADPALKGITYSALIAKGYDAEKYNNSYLINNYVATVTDANGAFVGGYSTLADAVAEATEGATITLLADATDSLVTIPSTVTLNAGGFDYTAYIGAGTSADPYQIGNLSTLKAFRDYVDLLLSDGTSQYAGKYFKLTSDIDLSGENWEPIGSMVGDHGSFKGVFDGDNHTIKNLSVQKAEKGLGFFSYTTGDAMIKNLTFTNVTVKSTAPTAHAKGSWVGGVVGDAFANTVISNVHVVGSIDIEGYGYVGGMVGHGYVKVYDSAVEGEGTIKGNMWCTGGIVGYAGEGTTDVRNSFVTGTGTGLTVQAAAGGCGAIVGMAEDDSGRSPISGSNLAATNVTVGTFVGGFGTSYATYCLGYLYGGNSDQNLSGDLIVNNVTFDAQGNTEPPVQDAVATVGNVIYFTLSSAVEAAQNGDATATVVRNLKLKESVAIATDTSINLASKTITLGTGVDYAFVLSGEGTTLSLANGTATVGTTGYPANYRLISVTSEGVTSYTAVACAAEIDGTPYRTFAEAIAAADAALADTGIDPVITVIDATAEQTNPDWKIDGDKLVRKVYVAQVVGGQSYETIAEAIAAAPDGGTVQVLVDCSIDAHIDVTKNLTLDLNGKTVVNNVNSARAIDLNADGVALTVKANGGGMVIAAGNSYGFFRMQKPNDRIVLDGGFYRGHTDCAALFRYNNTDQSMVLSNVTAEAVGSALMANYISGSAGHYNNLEIVGGSFMTSGANPATVDSEVFRLYGMNGSIKDAVIVCNITSPSGGYNGCMNIQINTGSEFVIEGCAVSNLVAKTASGQNTWASCLTVAYDAHIKVLNCDLYSAQYGVYVFSSGATVELENSNLKADYKALYSQLAVNGSNGDNAVSSGIIKVKSGLVDGTISADYWNFDTTKYADFFAAGIQIEGGKFKNFVVECPDTPNTIMAISGGVFDHPVIQRFCAENYEPADNTDVLTKDEYPYTVVLKGVAKIGDTYYQTLAAASDAAEAGETVLLVMNVAEPFVLEKNVSVTLNLNGNTISVADGNAISATAGELTVTSVVDDEGYATGGVVGAVSVSEGASLNLTGGIYDVDWDDCNIEGTIAVSSVNRFYDDYPTEVEAASAVFTSPVPYEYCANGFIPGAYNDIYIDGDYYYYVKEGSFRWKVTDIDGKVAYSEEVPYADDDEEWWEYDWFGEHEMNRNGFTMTLLHDVSADDDNFSAYVSGVTYTIDLGGHTVNRQLSFGAGKCYVTITNGVVRNAEETGVSVDCGAQVTLGDGLVIAQSTTGVYVVGGTEDGEYSKLTVTDGAVVNGEYGVLVFGSGSENPVTEVVVAGGEINGTVYGISGNGKIEGDEDYSNTRISISGGMVTGGDAGIYHPQAGELSVSGGAITGGMAIYAKSGTISVTGGELSANGAGGQYDVSYTEDGPQHTGDAFVVDSANYPGGNPTATISGGTFISLNGNGVASYAITGQTTVSNFVSGGYFSQYVTDIYCASGYLCTTAPVANGYYQVVQAARVTFELGEGAPDGADAPDELSYPSGNPAETALPQPTYTSTDKTFAGWKVNGEGNAVSALPAGTTGAQTLVATWTGAKSIQIDAGGTELTTIKVTDEWLEANGLADEEDTAKIRAALEKSVNSVPAWESYVLGQSIGAAVSSGAEQGETTLMPVTSTIDVPAVDTGFDVQYRLDKVDASGNVVAEGTAQATPDLALELSGVASSAYYRLVAVVTAKDGSGASVSVQANNTIGVLAVNSSAKSMIVAVPWASLDDGGEISVSNLVRTATLSEGDELKVYDPNTGTYKVWTLNSSKEWEPNTTVTESGSSLAPSAYEYSVPRGVGVWLTRTDTTQPIYLVGEVAEQSTTTTIAGAQGNEPTWNLVAAPTVEAVNLNDKFPNANEGDVVLVPTDGAPMRYTYKDDSWGYDDYVTTVNKRGIEVVKVVRKTDVTNVPIGTGFWYMNAGDAKNVEW